MEALIAIIAFAVWCATIGLGRLHRCPEGAGTLIEGLAFGLLLAAARLLIEVLLPDGQERVSSSRRSPRTMTTT